MKILIKGLFLILGLISLTAMAVPVPRHIDMNISPGLVFRDYALHSLIYAGNYSLIKNETTFRFSLYENDLCDQYGSHECTIVEPLQIVPNERLPKSYCEISKVVVVLQHLSPHFLPMTVQGHGLCHCFLIGNTLDMQNCQI